MLAAQLLLEPAQMLRGDIQIGGQHPAGNGLDNLGPVFQHGQVTFHGRTVNQRQLPLADAYLGRGQAEHPSGKLLRTVDERIERCAVHPEQRGRRLAGFGHQEGGSIEVKREGRHEYRTGGGKAEGRLLGVVHMKEADYALLDAEHVGADLPEIDDAATRLDLNFLHGIEEPVYNAVRRAKFTLFLDQLFQILIHIRNISQISRQMQNIGP